MLITEPRIAIEGDLVFDDALQLANGRLIWLERLSEAITPSEPEPVPVAQMVRYMSPDSQDISSPGYLLVGVNLA